MVRVGWDFTQFYGTDTTTNVSIDYYRINYKPYVDVQVYIDMIYNIENLITEELEFYIEQFRYDYFVSLILND